MKFNIIDGTQDNTDYDQILRDYQNLDLTVREIREKHGLTASKWQTLTKQWKQQGIPLRGRMSRKKHRYIATPIASKNYSRIKSGRYRVHKRIKGKDYVFGIYDTEEEAKHRVEYLKKNNWDGLL